MLKKILCLLLIAILPAALCCACGNATVTPGSKPDPSKTDPTDPPPTDPTTAPTTKPTGVDGPAYTDYEVLDFTADLLQSNQWSATWSTYRISHDDGSVAFGNGTDKYLLACYTDKEAMFNKVISLDMAVEIKDSLALELRTRQNSGLGSTNNSYYLQFTDQIVNGSCHLCVQPMKYASPDYIALAPYVDIEALVDIANYNNYKIGLINENDGVRFLLWVNDVLVINFFDDDPGNLNTAGYLFFQGAYSVAGLRGTDTDVPCESLSAVPMQRDDGLVTYDISNLGALTTRKLATIMQGYTFTSSEGFQLPYRIYLPTHYSADKQYPLQMHLHGGGLRGNDNLTQLQGDFDQIQMLLDHQAKEEFIFVMPECPADKFWSDGQRYDAPSEKYTFDLSEKANSIQIRALVELIDYLSRTYSVDTTRLYTSGASLGGCGQYDLIYSYPDLFAGSIIGCGLSDLDTAQACKNTPIFLIHGEQDPILPVQNSRDMYAALQALGADVVYVELAGQGHGFHQDGLWEQAMEWIFSKRRTK
ncbi:MAG: prolyl oligopeptidase family serine peptidase [Clostridia bacterium]|nr:prolyl oligopeptidase family serine peptidase [Clostridia bacterium]